jgi:hypothetical protein
VCAAEMYTRIGLSFDPQASYDRGGESAGDKSD